MWVPPQLTSPPPTPSMTTSPHAARWAGRVLPGSAVADRSPRVPRPRRHVTSLQARKRSVTRALDWTGEVFGHHERFARIALDEVADVADPTILELGAGHGGLSRKLLDWHPTARLTVTDSNPPRWRRSPPVSSVRIPARRYGKWTRPRSTPPTDSSTWRCSRCRSTTCRRRWRPRCSPKAPGRRRSCSIIDLPRPPPPLHLLRLAHDAAVGAVVPFVHDGVISSLRTYSPSALRALAAHADPAIDVALRGGGLSPQVAVARRRG